MPGDARIMQAKGYVAVPDANGDHFLFYGVVLPADDLFRMLLSKISPGSCTAWENQKDSWPDHWQNNNLICLFPRHTALPYSESRTFIRSQEIQKTKGLNELRNRVTGFISGQYLSVCFKFRIRSGGIEMSCFALSTE